MKITITTKDKLTRTYGRSWRVPTFSPTIRGSGEMPHELEMPEYVTYSYHERQVEVCGFDINFAFDHIIKDLRSSQLEVLGGLVVVTKSWEKSKRGYCFEYGAMFREDK